MGCSNAGLRYLSIMLCYVACTLSCSGTPSSDLAVEGKLPLELRLAFSSADGCSECRPYSFTDGIGLARTRYANARAGAVVRPEDIRDIEAWMGPSGHAALQIVFEDSGRGVVGGFATQAETSSSVVLFSMAGITLGEFDHRLLRASSGVVSFSFFEDQTVIRGRAGCPGRVARIS